VTPKIVTVCAPERPICRPKNPANSDPNKGDNAAMRYKFIFVIEPLAFHCTNVIDVNGFKIPE
jgi:hypothetical protein